MSQLTIKQAHRKFSLSARKISYLIRQGHLAPIVDNGRILLEEGELARYLGLPEKTRKKHHASYLKTLGPGLITGASDDDPSGIGTYSMAGSAYGLSLAWLSLYLLPMMTAVQETVARIGIVTGKGLAGAISKHYGKRCLYPLIILLVIANTVNIGADIGAMAAALRLVFPINFAVAALLLTGLMLVLEVSFEYHRYAKFLKWLTLSLLAYIVTGFLIRPDWMAVARSIAIPHVEWNSSFLTAMVAVMGTTITPYLFFWQASEEIEEEKDRGGVTGNAEHHHFAITREIKEMRKDTYFGMSLANIVFLFIIVVTAFVLNKNGVTNIQSAEDAAMALRPLAGDYAAWLFLIGILGVGLLAVPVLAGSSAYGIAELFKWHEGLNKKYSRAKGFYGVIIASMLVGLGLNLAGVNPIKALYYAAIINGLVSPILLIFIFRIGSDKKIMGKFISPRWVKLWGAVVTVLMGVSGILLVCFWLLGL